LVVLAGWKACDAFPAWLSCYLVSGFAPGEAYVVCKRTGAHEMSKQNNLFQRAINAIVDGRTRQAERFVARFEREHDLGRKVNGR